MTSGKINKPAEAKLKAYKVVEPKKKLSFNKWSLYIQQQNKLIAVR
jgi:hypothetical protein